MLDEAAPVCAQPEMLQIFQQKPNARFNLLQQPLRIVCLGLPVLLAILPQNERGSGKAAIRRIRLFRSHWAKVPPGHQSSSTCRASSAAAAMSGPFFENLPALAYFKPQPTKASAF